MSFKENSFNNKDTESKLKNLHEQKQQQVAYRKESRFAASLIQMNL